ncbi:MAG: cobyrinate a,c-diamide synthase [Bacteroidaceae bacterium]|nr:cobyrinate a,c-diamide synthase [Bacteroidaceae bacterium]
MKPQILISATNAGSGKTIFAMGLICALRRKGFRVQPFKCGPEVSDSQLLTLSAGHETINLDTWFASYTNVQHLYNQYGEKADVCLIEGNGGLFDGYKRLQGSSAEITKLLNIPVILLVNARASGYSVASVIYGFKHFHPKVRIGGVVFNQITSPAQYAFLREACADAGVDCLGYLPQNIAFKLPSKHTSITLTTKKALDVQANLAADYIEQYVDVNRLLNGCNRNFPCQYTLPYSSDIETEIPSPSAHPIKIAIARDPAFNHIYPENIARLALNGKITYFSPVYGTELPEADFIYLPGGYPELFARQLHRRRKIMDALKAYAENGGRIFAECGGMVFLGRSLTVREGGTAYPMSGVLPLDFTAVSAKLISGYRKLIYNDVELKGNEFHYSNVATSDTSLVVTQATNLKGGEVELPLYRYKNVIASYGHWYWGDKNLFDLWK